MEIPAPRRPSLSRYIDQESTKRLAWPWVSQRMAVSRAYWITTRSKGFPHSRPVWGLWHDPQLLFSTGSLIAKNIARDPRVEMHLEDSEETIIIEGTVAPMPAALLDFWLAQYKAKYHWDMPATTDGAFMLTPVRVIAWICDNDGLDGGAQFANSATEWRFAT